MSLYANDVNFGQVADELLADVRRHVNQLHERLGEADELLSQSHAVSEKIEVMKVYNNETSAFNSCFRNKDRGDLVRSLQHENREILNLQEENRQLKQTLEDVQHGMTLLMEKHRKVIRDMSRSDDLVQIVRDHYINNNSEKKYERRFYEFADLTSGILKKLEEQHVKDVEKMSEICAENKYLRACLAARGALVPGVNAKQDGTPLELKAEASRHPYRPITKRLDDQSKGNNGEEESNGEDDHRGARRKSSSENGNMRSANL
ncbi:unnamed protein product [Bursaphelenchus xylophilus]|uniref:(pine wood nematode) hypothetical protein n=1 Tax=Bursaphelenchus xylophilus TaxID=6326 RepID=A0A1I7RZR6_BURXY|nr:unnamed protein product [Bursaphelenchus xylophilus]CAG9111644.1 unnamed protein product [Bursaphelenchus xylophilus]